MELMELGADGVTQPQRPDTLEPHSVAGGPYPG